MCFQHCLKPKLLSFSKIKFIRVVVVSQLAEKLPSDTILYFLFTVEKTKIYNKRGQDLPIFKKFSLINCFI